MEKKKKMLLAVVIVVIIVVSALLFFIVLQDSPDKSSPDKSKFIGTWEHSYNESSMGWPNKTTITRMTFYENDTMGYNITYIYEGKNKSNSSITWFSYELKGDKLCLRLIASPEWIYYLQQTVGEDAVYNCEYYEFSNNHLILNPENEPEFQTKYTKVT